MSASDRDRRRGRAAALAAGLLAGLATAGSALASERAKPSRLCPQDAPEGVRLPARPGCDIVEERRGGDADGFRDLGNGVKLRVGGRAGLSVDTRH